MTLPPRRSFLCVCASVGTGALVLILALAFTLVPSPVRAQQPWSPVLSPTSRTLWGIAASEDQFVAVGEAGTILTSPDGLAWTSRISGTDTWLLAIAWSPTLRTFIVVGDRGTILTSPDGIAWTPRASGTTQRLNSVAWTPKRFTSPNLFIAVGENGTALTSSDLATWTARPTGFNGWLRGLASGGADHVIVTGQDGMILITQDAGETFQSRDSGTTRHLDAVTRFASGTYYATGVDFALTRSTDGGQTWTLDRTVNPDGRENGIVYNGLATFNNALVAVGDQGRLRDEFGRPWRTTEPLLAGWRAVTASRDRVVAVGTGGAIAAAPLDPGLALEHALDATFLSDAIVLTATVRRHISPSPTYTIQWLRDGHPIAGATQRTLHLETTTGAPGAIYTFTATTSDNLSFRADFTLETQPSPITANFVDPTFRPRLTAATTALAPLPDGRLYVATADSTLLRLNPDGTRDPTFAPSGNAPAGLPVAIIVQPDGRPVVFDKITGPTPQFRATRFGPDGSSDAGFRPDPALISSGETPILLADGRWLAVERKPTTQPASSDDTFAAILHRFHADGSRDSTFSPVELLTSFSAHTLPSGIRSFFTGPRALATRDAENRIYLGVQHADFSHTGLSASSGTTRLFRLHPDGSLDTTFTPRDVGPLHVLQATPRGLVARTSLETWARLRGTTVESSLFRLQFDGTLDPSFAPKTRQTTNGDSLRLPTGLGRDYDVLAVAPDGTVFVRTTGHHGHFGIIHFDTRGELDRDFSAELGSAAATLTHLVSQPDGRLLVGGTFQSLLGTDRSYLARLKPDTHAAATHLANVSVRARVGAEPLIAGYATRGGEVSVLARAAGPALAGFGVADFLPDPQLALFSGPAEISRNDHWHQGPVRFLGPVTARLGAFPFAAGSTDATLYTSSSSTPLTVHVTGKDNASGVALAELYHDTAAPSDANAPRIVNFSVRSITGSGADSLIVGFTLAGPGTRNLVLRAVGPALARFGITDSLPDPVLTLYRAGTPIATNDDWAANTETHLTLGEAFATVGAFPLETTPAARVLTSSKDSALLLSLAPGLYTVHVTAKNAATGIALLEIYEVP